MADAGVLEVVELEGVTLDDASCQVPTFNGVHGIENGFPRACTHTPTARGHSHGPDQLCCSAMVEVVDLVKAAGYLCANCMRPAADCWVMVPL